MKTFFSFTTGLFVGYFIGVGLMLEKAYEDPEFIKASNDSYRKLRNQ